MPDLDFMFHPKSIAVVGASPQPLAPTNVHFFYPLLLYGYTGKLYPVHPKADKAGTPELCSCQGGGTGTTGWQPGGLLSR